MEKDTDSLFALSLVTGFLLTFLMSLTELTVSSLLYSSKSRTIGATVLSFQQAGYKKTPQLFSGIIVTIILAGYLIWSALGPFNLRRKYNAGSDK